MFGLYSARINSRDCESIALRVVPFDSRISLRAINRFAPNLTNGWTGTVLGITVLITLCITARAPAGTPPAAAPASQVWLVDTRCAPGCGDLEAGTAQIRYWRLADTSRCGQWNASDLAGFQASADPSLPTVVLVHGYGTDPDSAVQHGNEVRNLLQQVGCGRSFRLVVWSWPADRSSRVVRGIRPDIQMKVCRSDVEAYYLARALTGMPRGEPLSLIGFSLGCRAASGALELLAGGAAGGRVLPPTSLETWRSTGLRPIRVMLLAAAVDCGWFEPSAGGGLAPLAVQQILVTENCGDRVLKYYSRLYGRGGPEAVGRVGPSSSAGGKLEVVDVACDVGPKHEFERYEAASPICRRLGWYTFLSGDAAMAGDSAKKPNLTADNRPAR